MLQFTETEYLLAMTNIKKLSERYDLISPFNLDLRAALLISTISSYFVSTEFP